VVGMLRAGTQALARRTVATCFVSAAALSQVIDRPPSAPDGSIVRIHFGSNGTETLATAVLVHRQIRDCDTVLYFLTSAQAHCWRDLRRVGTRVTSWKSEGDVTMDVALPVDVELDLAVLTVVTREQASVPVPVTLSAPHLGDRFVVEALDGTGARIVRNMQVRMVSSRLAVSDRDMSDLPGCLGTPAFRGDSLFGVVAECAPARSHWSRYWVQPTASYAATYPA
jgi:hypothetical protein